MAIERGRRRENPQPTFVLPLRKKDEESTGKKYGGGEVRGKKYGRKSTGKKKYGEKSTGEKSRDFRWKRAH
jgi:hypothetical protein